MAIVATPPELKVPLTNELIRIQRMPRRVPEDLDRIVEELTRLLGRPGNTMKLRPLQALALYELGTEGGLFAPMRVGGGKTLISLLAGAVSFAERPLLLVPAKLLGKTDRDRRVLGQFWFLADFVRVMSYEWLGRAQAAEALEIYCPDLIIADECHKLKNPRAAVTRRVRRHMEAHPETKFAGMSGTITKRSLFDYAHLALWSLKDQSPLPRNYTDLEGWADALDERKGQTKRCDPGALEILCNAEEQELWKQDRRRAARLAYRRRLVETSGVVASVETEIDATLTIEAIEPSSVGDKIEQAFERLRRDWETPDGWPITNGLDFFRHAREIALGFFYVWDPRPPREWLDARKAWSQYVRRVLKHSSRLDSELQVRRAHPYVKELVEWKAIEDTFKPKTTPVWLDDSMLKICAEWAERERGIIWTEHTYFGERLGEMGLTYYGREGRSVSGVLIEDHPAGSPLVASIQSNGEGRNLQAWSTNLLTSCPANGSQMEQVIGRTHRDGQEADEVSVDLLTICSEHLLSFWQAMSDCEYVATSTGAPQKLLLAGVNVPTVDDLVFRSGVRWAHGRD